MKNYLKTSKWLRWVAAGVFGLMLVLNIMVSLQFDKDKILPSITLIELGNMAMAQGETSEEFTRRTGCVAVWENVSCPGKDGVTHTYARPE